MVTHKNEMPLSMITKESLNHLYLEDGESIMFNGQVYPHYREEGR